NIVANNLAWVLSESEGPDLERALAMIDAVIRRGPVVPPYRGTRGHILVKLGRFQEALPRLEAALPVNQATDHIHRDLSRTYQKLGMTGLAKVHEEKAKALAAGATGQPPQPDPGQAWP